MFISYRHECVRLTGRWDTQSEKEAVATATGSYLEFAFRGRTAIARFDTDRNRYPLHLWMQLDGGPMCEAPISYALRFVATSGDDSTEHVARIIFKGGTEASDRWYLPLCGCVRFLGIQLTEPAQPATLPPDNRRTIEFVGDSITEGVLIDTDYHEGFRSDSYIDQLNRGFQDDVCATYAWLTAEGLNLRPYFMGYGAVGTTKAGVSDVPVVSESYPFNFENSPVSYPPCDYIVINHGTNDRGKGPEMFLAGYLKLLNVIREKNPKATIVALSPFCGFAKTELGLFIRDYNEKYGCNIHFINGGEWIDPTPVHPHRDGHRTVAEHLIPLMREIIEKA